MQKFHFYTNCIGSTFELIDAMRDNEKEVTREEFLEHCDSVDKWARERGYEDNPDEGLTLADDWHVSYHRSTYDGRPCFYLCWSSIEFIWTCNKAA